MKRVKQTLAWLLACMMMISMCPVYAAVPAGGTTVITAEQFLQNASANTTGITAKTVTNGTGMYHRYISIDVSSLGDTGASRAMNYYDNDGTWGLKGNVKTNDVLLARMVVRATNADGSEGELYIALHGGTGTTTASSSKVYFTSAWTEIYIPIKAKSDASCFNLRVGGKIQKLDVAELELINYKTTKTTTDLPSTVTIVEVTAPEGATKLISTQQFMQYAKPNVKETVVTKTTDADGLYGNYMSVNVTSLGTSSGSRAVHINDDGSNLVYADKIAAGDVLLARMVVRATNTDGSEGDIYLALYNEATERADRLTTKHVAFTSVWTEIYIPIKAKDDPNCLNIRVGSKLQTLDIAEFELFNYKSTKTVEELPSTVIRLEAEPEGEKQTMVNFFDGLTGTESSTVLPQYPISKKITNQTYTFTAAQTEDIANSDLIVCHLVVRAARSTALTLTFDKYSDKTMTYYVPAQWTEIRVLLEGRGLKSVAMSAENEIEIAGAWFVDHDAADSLTVGQETGMYLLEDYDYYPLAEQGTGTGKSIDLVKNGNYVYSIGDGRFSVTDVSGVPVVTDTIEGLGVNIRQIAITEDASHVMVTSRENGAYIINVEDPHNAYVRTVYHSIEMATGITISGNYAFICNRYYGVEIVDISDLDHPIQVSIVSAGEVQSCEVKDNILYCGVWGTRSVEMYDISDPNLPTWLGSATLNGKGDGMAVYTKGDKTYLYAATGHHTWGVSSSAQLTNLYYGQGNGLDIFDVTDPTNPIHLSTSKIDGRYYYSTYDYWETEIAQSEDGHLYAYLVNTFNGIYVYNVDEPTAPKRVAHIDIPIAKDSPNYVYYSSSSTTFVFPYNQAESARSPVGACVVEDGKMYVAGVLTDLHIFENSDILFAQEEALPIQPDVAPNGTYYTFDGSGLAGYRLFDSTGQINSIKQYGDRYFLAAGNDGIIEINENMERLSTTATNGICFDVAIYGDTLYAAEGDNGVSAYRIESKGLTRLWNYPSVNGTVRSLTLSPKGRFIVFQAGARYGEIISTETQKNVVNYHSGSQMYYRNVSPLIGGRYIFIWGFSSGGGKWYDFGTEDNYTEPKLVCTMATPRIGTHSGHIADYNGNALSFVSNGYIIYDPATTTDVSSLTAYTTDQEESFSGFAAIKDDLMIVTNRPDRKLHITDISDITQPKILKTLTLPGNPDQALITDKYVWVPVGYQGLMRFDLSYWQNATGHNWDNGTQTKESTCSELGEITFTCADCSETRVEKTACADHVWKNEYTVDSSATCNEMGSKSIHCKDCDAVKEGSATKIPATNQHTPGQLIEDVSATCGAAGRGHKECTVCQKTVQSNIVIPATEKHTYDNACDTTCNSCGATRTVNGHKYDNNCDTTCNICGTTRTITHSYGEYVYNNDATYEKDGTKTRTCSVCGNKETITAEGTKLTQPVIDKPVITNPFTDVKNDKFYYDAVLWAVNNDVTTGTSANTFSPDNKCTRGQIVTFLWRAAGSPKASTTNTAFTDIKKGSYYYDAVIWAVENGITSGTTATTFSPNSTCTRGQIVTFLWRFWGQKEATVANPFTDTTSSAYYTKAMLWAVEKGITTGTSATTFGPNNACTRSQCVTFLYRSFGN